MHDILLNQVIVIYIYIFVGAVEVELQAKLIKEARGILGINYVG